MTELLMTQGVSLVGVSTRETLAGGPPSTDLEHVLPGAKSAITFAVPLDPNKIELCLSKQDHAGHQGDNTHTNAYVSGATSSSNSMIEAFRRSWRGTDGCICTTWTPRAAVNGHEPDIFSGR